jgi:hypothetical protein
MSSKEESQASRWSDGLGRASLPADLAPRPGDGVTCKCIKEYMST